MDARIPTCMLVGYFGRDVTRTARDNARARSNLIEPTLDTWGIKYFSHRITGRSAGSSPGVRAQHANIDGPSVVLVGAPTA